MGSQFLEVPIGLACAHAITPLSHSIVVPGAWPATRLEATSLSKNMFALTKLIEDTYKKVRLNAARIIRILG
jgi:hypothetical protein